MFDTRYSILDTGSKFVYEKKLKLPAHCKTHMCRININTNVAYSDLLSLKRLKRLKRFKHSEPRSTHQ